MNPESCQLRCERFVKRNIPRLSSYTKTQNACKYFVTIYSSTSKRRTPVVTDMNPNLNNMEIFYSQNYRTDSSMNIFLFNKPVISVSRNEPARLTVLHQSYELLILVVIVFLRLIVETASTVNQSVLNTFITGRMLVFPFLISDFCLYM